MDPLSGTPWSTPETVAGFAQSQPNAELMRFAEDELRRGGRSRLLDLGCGAGRNAVPLALLGWHVLGIDLSRPMLAAAAGRAADAHLSGRLQVALAPMDRIPVTSQSCDFVIAHGIWNLARTTAEFRRGVAEATRVCTPGAALFVFTFSRNTIPPEAVPVAGEAFVFTEFSGAPQCFLTGGQLVEELVTAGFTPDSAVPLRELNLPRPGTLRSGGAPVIFEGAFRFRG